ncbi:BUD13 homolog, partial [Diaphorina citri]
MRNLNNDELELYQLSEDAPVIAGVVDERPLEVQLADRYKDNRWKAITGGSDDDIVITDKNQSKSKTREVTKSRNYEDSDMSPPRKSKHKAKKPGADF